MTENRVPTAEARFRHALQTTVAEVMPSLAASLERALDEVIAEQPAPPLDVRQQVVAQIKERFPEPTIMGEQINPFDLYALLDEVAQPAPPHRFVAAYFGDPDRDPACGICRRPFVEHREQPAPPLDVLRDIETRLTNALNADPFVSDPLWRLRNDVRRILGEARDD